MCLNSKEDYKSLWIRYSYMSFWNTCTWWSCSNLISLLDLLSNRGEAASVIDIHSNTPVSFKGSWFRLACEVGLNLWFLRWLICALIYCASKHNSNLNLLSPPNVFSLLTTESTSFVLWSVQFKYRLQMNARKGIHTIIKQAIWA